MWVSTDTLQQETDVNNSGCLEYLMLKKIYITTIKELIPFLLFNHEV